MNAFGSPVICTSRRFAVWNPSFNSMSRRDVRKIVRTTEIRFSPPAPVPHPGSTARVCPDVVFKHVSHLNGTVEELESNENRSPLLLEEDTFDQRVWSVEANKLFNFMAWNRRFVEVDMSFECGTDRFLGVATLRCSHCSDTMNGAFFKSRTDFG
jgi:hypothetical protein